MDCSVCVEKFNKSTRLKCVCPNCDYAICRACIQQFALGSEQYNLSCMNCKKTFTQDTLDTFFTKQFRSVDLKTHREKILFEREKSLLPATQPAVQKIITIRKHKEHLEELNEQRRILENEIRNIGRLVYLLSRDMDTGEGLGADMMKEKRVFTINCPRQECRGFVHNSTWECGICNHFVCKECHEYIGETKECEHTCCEDSIKTAQLIKKDSKPCPGCSTLIFKISGCSQMWCTQCHTTFIWDSLNIVLGTVHNPHYYEWIKENGGGIAQRNLGDIPCGGIITIGDLRNVLKNARITDVKDMDAVFCIHRVLMHIEHEELPRYRTDNTTDNLDLRVKYLMNEVDEDQFKILLQQREKKNAKNKEVYDVFEMYLFTTIDLFNNMIATIETKTFIIASWLQQIVALREFANTQFSKICVRYGCVVPLIELKQILTKKHISTPSSH